MTVTFGDRSYAFRPWRRDLGRVLRRGYSFDSETTLIDPEHPWITPAYVIGAAFDGDRGWFITRSEVAEFFQVHRNLPVAMHNAPFDLAVIHTLAPGLGIYDWVEGNRVWDTQLMHRLHALATEGHTAAGAGESTLERCTRQYTGLELPKDLTDSEGNNVRLSYGRWLKRPPGEIEQVYLDYLAKDVVATRLVRTELGRRTRTVLAASGGEWGFVSTSWLQGQIQQWGPQTHHIQLRAAVVLREVTGNGLHLDVGRRHQLVEDLENVLERRRRVLARHGYLPGTDGSNKALQSILRRLQRQHPEVNFPRTETGQFSTAYDAICGLAEMVPFVREVLEYREVEKLLNSFVKKMNGAVLHPSFNVMARTGRTSSFGDINAQNLPTDDRVRSCFVPSPDHVFIDADYKTIELATLGQACTSQFGLESHMADAINAGKDLHRLVAARVTNKSEGEVTDAERKSAKPINFGKPGGMSDRTLALYAMTTYGVELNDEQVANLSKAWFDLFPEMRAFLGDDDDLGLEVATLLELTASSHYEHTGDDRFARHPENSGREEMPHPILGVMALKAFKASEPATAAGRPYPATDLDYFWSKLEARVGLLPPRHHDAVHNRRASPGLREAVRSISGRRGVFTLTGRLRAKASYCARHNTVFQGLAADGMKLALWRLWRGGYRIVNEVHDQFLIEVPVASDLKRHAEKIRTLMIAGMRAVVPDVRVDASYAATDRWHKEAKAVHAGDGTELLLWRPTRPGGVVGSKQKAVV